MNKLLFTILLLTLTSCAAWQEMGRTGKPPVAAANRYKATTQMVCDTIFIGDAYNWALDMVHLFVPLTTSFDPRCLEADSDPVSPP